jgi:hypothetical protein
MTRIEAVHWRDFSADMAEIPLTPLSRLFVERPEMQAALRTSHRQMDGRSSVAIMLPGAGCFVCVCVRSSLDRPAPRASHIKCWEWLLAAPQHTHALVLEDDACMEPDFAAAFADAVLPLLEVPDEWDCLFLGYFGPRGGGEDRTVPTPRGPVRLRVIPQFFGAHAYVVSRRAAAVLRRNAYPLDQQSDGLLLTLRDLGLLRVYCLPAPVVTQCMDTVDRLGSRHTHSVVAMPGDCDRCWWALVAACALLVALVAVGAVRVYRRRRARGRGGGPAAAAVADR